ncbi:MAG TPA: PIN domain-containing protein [Thermoanaerobaculia bacterium]
MTGVLDSAVIIDLLRGYPPALIWISTERNAGVTSIGWLEVIEGAKNRKAQREVLRILRRFERIDTVREDYDWAILQCLKLKLSHNVGMMDCLMAAISHRLQLPFYSPNLRHFQPLLGDLAVRPY